MNRNKFSDTKAKEVIAKIVRYSSFGMPARTIAERLKVSKQYISEILKRPKLVPGTLTKIIYHTKKISELYSGNRREVLAELLGFPIDDWSDAKVEEELRKL